jgi:hypothetical protein
MKYFLDTEFHEYKKKPLFGKAIDTIELISIGIVAEDGREYYAISKDFDIKAAWNNEWLRENVLKSIHNELSIKENNSMHEEEDWFTFRSLYVLIKKYGKSNKQIAEEIKLYVSNNEIYINKVGERYYAGVDPVDNTKLSCEFYGYYCDYDWVVFCWLFGRMIDLPKGFPMHCIDLKQSLDEAAAKVNSLYFRTVSLDEESSSIPSELIETNVAGWDLGKKLQLLKHQSDYPKQANEHNALADAKWNHELYKFLQRL